MGWVEGSHITLPWPSKGRTMPDVKWRVGGVGRSRRSGGRREPLTTQDWSAAPRSSCRVARASRGAIGRARQKVQNQIRSRRAYKIG